MSTLKNRYLMPKFLWLLLFILSILIVSCDEEITTPQNTLTVLTSKTTYHNEKVIVRISNHFDKNVYVQKCADRLLYFIERLDSGYSGGTAVFICRQPYNIAMEPSTVLIDTIELFPGKYRTKHFYDFEDTQFLDKEIYSNTFIVY